MKGQVKKYDTYLDQVGALVGVQNPYELPKPLGFSLSKAVKFAKQNNVKIADIPLNILKTL